MSNDLHKTLISFHFSPVYLGYMANGGNKLYSLIPLEDFKAILCIDDREDALARFCLAAATGAIEHYCMRRLLRKTHFEQIELNSGCLLPLREYPVTEILAVYAISSGKQGDFCEEFIEPDCWRVFPDCGSDIDIPFSVELSPAVARIYGWAVKVVYWAGYDINSVPLDLASACLELASWNLSRYKGRRVGMAGNLRGAGLQGEHFELSMPENVRGLLEPYKRRFI